MFGVLVVWVVAAIIAAIIAEKKNRSIMGWVLLCVLLSPLALLVLLALEPLKNTVEDPGYGSGAVLPPPPAAASDDKTCPMCAEQVKAAALICKHCRHEFAPAAEAPIA